MSTEASNQQQPENAEPRLTERRVTAREFRLQHLLNNKNNVARLSRVQNAFALIYASIEADESQRRLCTPETVAFSSLDGVPFKVEFSQQAAPAASKEDAVRSLGLLVDFLLSSDRSSLTTPEQWMRVRKTRKYHSELLLLLDQLILVPGNAQVDLSSKHEAFVAPEEPEVDPEQQHREQTRVREMQRQRSRGIALALTFFALGMVLGIAFFSEHTVEVQRVPNFRDSAFATNQIKTLIARTVHLGEELRYSNEASARSKKEAEKALVDAETTKRQLSEYQQSLIDFVNGLIKQGWVRRSVEFDVNNVGEFLDEVKELLFETASDLQTQANNSRQDYESCVQQMSQELYFQKEQKQNQQKQKQKQREGRRGCRYCR